MINESSIDNYASVGLDKPGTDGDKPISTKQELEKCFF
ncbi:Hypothetical protein ADU72_0187 [Pediococcus damnosus]|uniref:Uncharacterized protein n=1 Tax=Pediococcus damnosus TaxID=51663 RepID=A0AAC9B072_9LACO|nr:Hypothetical protein ADU69_0089 [Pediococcus damnosus]AMV61984.1 Hypothetical protein ADU70_0484 [Pediococcus damnosus]AMV64013.1 Hypothetical protein ADU71_0090 [Pediococcus damnosus]AMV66136.1 Hypothetical protein ADU72_0187 [Pediococcus damnosus]AMV68423.1 Hypothetical protein ADU73_0011 [Pediococcus damnosus]